MQKLETAMAWTGQRHTTKLIYLCTAKENIIGENRKMKTSWLTEQL
jgi:hypothetical protein